MDTYAPVVELAEPAEGQPHVWQSASARRAGDAPHVAETASAVEAPVAQDVFVAQELPAVTAPVAEEIPVVAEEYEAVVVAAPVVEAPAAQVAVVQPVAPQAEVVAVTEGEWVDLTADAPQGVVEVDNVEVAVVPQVEDVPLSADTVTLTAPSVYGEKTVRALPESRYSSRRQAVYNQQYARRAAVERVN